MRFKLRIFFLILPVLMKCLLNSICWLILASLVTVPSSIPAAAQNDYRFGKVRQSDNEVIYQAIWSPDGRIAAVSTSTGIMIFSTTAPYALDLNADPRMLERGGSIAFSPDSTLFISEEYATDILWDTTTWEQIASLPFRHTVTDFAFSHDASMLAISGGETSGMEDCHCTVDLWRVGHTPQAATKIGSLAINTQYIWQSLFSRDNRILIVISRNEPAQVWYVQSLTEIASFNVGAGGYSFQATLNTVGDRLLVESSFTTADDGLSHLFNVWDMNLVEQGVVENLKEPLISFMIRHASPLPTLNHSETIVSLNSGVGDISFYDMQTGVELTRIRSASNVQAMAFSVDDQHFWTVNTDGGIWIWDVTQALSYGMDRLALPLIVAHNEDEAKHVEPDFLLPQMMPLPTLLGLANGS
jgi:WD40 repeat protein